MALLQTLIDDGASLPVIDTHSHFLNETNIDLTFILMHSYAQWKGVDFGPTREERQRYIDQLRYSNYYVWLTRALSALYDLPQLSTDNWDAYDARIRERYQRNPQHAYDILGNCHYEKMILDPYWQPGSNHGRPELFAPTYRLNMFFFGYNKDALDHNSQNPLVHYGVYPDTLDGYVAFMRGRMEAERANGCCAFKNALAYDRGLDFVCVTKDAAEKAYANLQREVCLEDVKVFQDYIFGVQCDIAAELDMPMQCHTGLGKMDRSGASWLLQGIESHLETRFVLMHGSYPYPGDLLGLIHNCRNVYADICWLPLISTACAVRVLEELIELSTSDRICWGCDAWTAEESHGALMAVRYVLAKVAEKKINEGFWTRDDARDITRRILYTNAKELFKL